VGYGVSRTFAKHAVTVLAPNQGTPCHLHLIGVLSLPCCVLSTTADTRINALRSQLDRLEEEKADITLVTQYTGQVICFVPHMLAQTHASQRWVQEHHSDAVALCVKLVSKAAPHFPLHSATCSAPEQLLLCCPLVCSACVPGGGCV
jgi:hypothetical protein